MQSIADGLPPEVAQQIHPDWRTNEADYWVMRDELMSNYLGTWIAFAEGKVIATGSSPVEVFHQGQQSGKHPYVICVGREDEPCRVRRTSFPYDQSYSGEALPLVTVEFRSEQSQPGKQLDVLFRGPSAEVVINP